MPLENFDAEVLAATQEDRPRRLLWMHTNNWEDDEAEIKLLLEKHLAEGERPTEEELRAALEPQTEREGASG
jgi:hypothetical protein